MVSNSSYFSRHYEFPVQDKTQKIFIFIILSFSVCIDTENIVRWWTYCLYCIIKRYSYIFLFVRDESRFQFFLVDWLILVSFFEGETVERIPRSLFNKEQTVSFDTRILKYWLGSLQFIDIYMFRPCLIIMMIVFVWLELTNTKSLNDTLFSIGESRSEPHIKYARNLFFD